MNVSEQFMEHCLGWVRARQAISLIASGILRKIVFSSPVHVSLFSPRLFHALVTIRVEASFTSDCTDLLQAFKDS